MTTATAETLPKAEIQKFAQEVRKLANAQFPSRGYKRVLAMPLNRRRAQIYTLQKSHWNITRRDCWAFAQGHAPRFPVRADEAAPIACRRD